MNNAILLTVDGELKAMPRRAPTLEECQKAVGGFVQMIEITFLSTPGQMLMDEDGKVKGYKVNKKATAIASSYSDISPNDYVVGDVVILMGTCRLK